MKSRAWILRPFPDGANNRLDLFRRESFVGVSWANTGDLAGQSREDIKRVVAASLGVEGVKLGIIYSTLDLITNRFSVGDFLLIPDGSEIFFARVESDYYYEKDHIAAHRRRVSWFETSVLRDTLPTNIRKALRSNRLIADISQYAPEIEILASGSGENLGSLKNTVRIKYPLRNNYEVSFEIPADTTLIEAKRLSNFLSTLFFEEGGK